MIHWGGSAASGLTIYHNGDAVLHFAKLPQLDALVKQCMAGAVPLPTQDPVTILDHRALRMLARDALNVALEMQA